MTPNEQGEASAEALTFGTAVRVVDMGMPEDTLEAFEKARWLFVEPSL